MRIGAWGAIVSGMTRDQDADPPRGRVVVELEAKAGTVAGTITTAQGDRPFWGWLELMSEVERVAGDDAAREDGDEAQTN